jgi:hypothetical protein
MVLLLQDGSTPLHACTRGELEVARLLLGAGAAVGAIDEVQAPSQSQLGQHLSSQDAGEVLLITQALGSTHAFMLSIHPLWVHTAQIALSPVSACCVPLCARSQDPWNVASRCKFHSQERKHGTW